MMADHARTHTAPGSDRASIFAPGGSRLMRQGAEVAKTSVAGEIWPTVRVRS